MPCDMCGDRKLKFLADFASWLDFLRSCLELLSSLRCSIEFCHSRKGGECDECSELDQCGDCDDAMSVLN